MAKTTVLALVLFSVVCAQALEIPAISSVAEKELSKPLKSPLLQKDAENCPTNGIFPIPGDCTAYIICRNGRERKRQCPKGFFFDSVMFCTPDDTADCGFPPTPSQTMPLDDFCPRMYGIFADPDNCRQYVVCHEGRGIVHKCPEGTVYVSYAGCLKGNTCPTPDKLENDKFKETSDRSVCNLPPDSGPCQGDFPRFYYNSETNRCEGFTYGGCQGNGNNFKTKRKCKRTCFRRNDNKRLYENERPEEGDMEDNLKTLDEVIDTVDTMRQVIDEQNVNNIKTSDERMCSPSYQSGPCYGYFPRYYYDTESKTCKKFTYGGCGGNENNFKTLDECKHRCARELETEDEDYKEFRCRKTGRFANPNNCDSYIECYVSSDQVDMELVQCPNYQHYNMETKQCDDKCNAQCDQTLACTCEWPHCLITCEKPNGLFPIPTNCRLYLQCRNSVPKVIRCPEEKAFDPELKECVNIEDTNCEPKANDVWSILKIKETN